MNIEFALALILTIVILSILLDMLSQLIRRKHKTHNLSRAARLDLHAHQVLKDGLLERQPVLVEYWKKVKETIHLFDGIIVKYVIQWSAILLALVGASAVVFSSSTQEVDFSLLAGIVAFATILISIPIAIKCWFYYELLEEALKVAEGIEKIMFHNDVYGNLAEELGLTLRLTKISTKRKLRITIFGWTILIPFVFLFGMCLGLMLYYFNQAFGWGLFGPL